jgi:predicted Zn-dependent protease
MALRICALVVTVSLSVAPIRTDCQANVATATHVETGDELDARLTATQRQQFDAAKKAQLARQYAEASAGFKALLQDLPGDSLLTKWASDAALDMGDSAYALGVLKPLVLANFEDWQAVAMLARAAAEQGDRQTRDAAMMNIVMLRQHGLAPPNMTQYVLERMKVGENVLTIWCSLVPAGPYKVYYVAMWLIPRESSFCLSRWRAVMPIRCCLRNSMRKKPQQGFAILRWTAIGRRD